MSALSAYISEGSSLVESEAGTTETQVWAVPAAGAGTSDFLWAAKAHGAPPKKGDRHPRDPSMIVLSRAITDLGGGRAQVVLEYGVPSQGGLDDPVGTIVDVRFDGTLVNEKRKKDTSGNALISGIAAYTATIQVGISLIEVDRVEQTRPPFGLLLNFQNHVNATAFNGFPARTLVMHPIRSRRIAASGNYLITYAFAVKLATWDFELQEIILDVVTAETTTGFPRTVVRGFETNDRVYRLHGLAEFNALGFSF